MANIIKDYKSLIGNTPIFEICNIERELNLKAKVLIKLENMNPGGSIKDRASLYMIEKAIQEGTITKDTIIMEATSGNTGIGAAAVCASLNLRCIIIMPEGMSEERIKIMKQLGAQVILTEKSLGMAGSIKKLDELKKEFKDYFVLNQFANESNSLAHYETTAKEIYEDCDGKIDYFISAVGTSGTIMGCSKYFKEKNKGIKVIAVEPSESAVLNKEKANIHKIQGIGAGFIPKLFDYKFVDGIEKANYVEAIAASKLLARKEGILVGISSGASLSVALKYAGENDNEGKTIVVILPDSASRYYSTELFD